jgi:hypothetical protein
MVVMYQRRTIRQEIKQFRTISFLNVEGKTFFAVLVRRVTSYIISNRYVDTSIQKGGIPGFSGCLKHISIIPQLMKEAKETKGGQTLVWLDPANAYTTFSREFIESLSITTFSGNNIKDNLGGIRLRLHILAET